MSGIGHGDGVWGGGTPLARGTLRTQRGNADNARFIPAGAGNTCQETSRLTLNSAYPRWRGEHMYRPSRRVMCFGLSPLARGTLDDIYNALAPERFIPAGAGNTGPSDCNHRNNSVYPRWRGEHDSIATSTTCPGGLSPLARGTPMMLVCHRAFSRFIPAGAGNT